MFSSGPTPPNSQLAAFGTDFENFLAGNSIKGGQISVRHANVAQVDKIYSYWSPTGLSGFDVGTTFRLNNTSIYITSIIARRLLTAFGAPAGLDTPIVNGLWSTPGVVSANPGPPVGVSYPSGWSSITPRMIIDGQSGLTPGTDDPLLYNSIGVSRAMNITEPPGKNEFFNQRVKTATTTTPGTGNDRSVLSFVFLGLFLERITLVPFHELLMRWLAADPVFLDSTSVTNSILRVRQSATQHRGADGEWAYSNTGTGTSIYDPRVPATPPVFATTQLPTRFGGGNFHLEGADSGHGLCASASAMTRIMSRFWFDGSNIASNWNGYSWNWATIGLGTACLIKWYPDGQTCICALYETDDGNTLSPLFNILDARVAATSLWV